VPSSSDRVRAALAAAGVSGEVRTFDESTHTSAEAAATLGVDVAQIAKTLVFLADGEPVVVIASGADRVDTAKLAEAVGAQRIKRADADAVRAATGFVIGGVSPAALPDGRRVYVDRALSAYDVIWASAGTPQAVFRCTYADLVAVAGAAEVDVAQR
jgi:Cys-tRNA(Pro) deacylase